MSRLVLTLVTTLIFPFATWSRTDASTGTHEGSGYTHECKSWLNTPNKKPSAECQRSAWFKRKLGELQIDCKGKPIEECLEETKKFFNKNNAELEIDCSGKPIDDCLEEVRKLFSQKQDGKIREAKKAGPEVR